MELCALDHSQGKDSGASNAAAITLAGGLGQTKDSGGWEEGGEGSGRRGQHAGGGRYEMTL